MSYDARQMYIDMLQCSFIISDNANDEKHQRNKFYKYVYIALNKLYVIKQTNKDNYIHGYLVDSL